VGGSLVASPLGEVVASAGDDPELVVADIDIDRVAPVREMLGVLRNRSEFAQSDKAESPR
jgi:predicted amidohydrolase